MSKAAEIEIANLRTKTEDGSKLVFFSKDAKELAEEGIDTLHDLLLAWGYPNKPPQWVGGSAEQSINQVFHEIDALIPGSDLTVPEADYLLRPVEDFGFSEIALHNLKEAGYQYGIHFDQSTDEQLLEVSGVGDKTVERIRYLSNTSGLDGTHSSPELLNVPAKVLRQRPLDMGVIKPALESAREFAQGLEERAVEKYCKKQKKMVKAMLKAEKEQKRKEAEAAIAKDFMRIVHPAKASKFHDGLLIQAFQKVKAKLYKAVNRRAAEIFDSDEVLEIPPTSSGAYDRTVRPLVSLGFDQRFSAVVPNNFQNALVKDEALKKRFQKLVNKSLDEVMPEEMQAALDEHRAKKSKKKKGHHEPAA